MTTSLRFVSSARLWPLRDTPSQFLPILGDLRFAQTGC
jgi:hypothetical protein